METPCETPCEPLSQRGTGSAANGYSLHGSRRSSLSKLSKVRLAIAQLKVKKLEEEQRLNVERRVKEEDEKLSYLIQYCKGSCKGCHQELSDVAP